MEDPFPYKSLTYSTHMNFPRSVPKFSSKTPSHPSSHQPSPRNPRNSFLQIRDPKLPGPGDYEVNTHILAASNSKLGVIMKESAQTKLKQIIHGPPVPGPGAYYTISSIGRKSHVFHSSAAFNMYPRRLGIQVRPPQITPGPGHYNTEKNKSKSQLKGKSFVSNYRSSSVAVLPKARKVTDPAKRENIPGPGSYNPHLPKYRPTVGTARPSYRYMVGQLS